MNLKETYLTPGRLVEFRDGTKGFVIPHTFSPNSIVEIAIVYNFGGYDMLSRWDNNMCNTHIGLTKNNSEYLDIIRVWEVGNAYDLFHPEVWDTTHRKCVWDRESLYTSEDKAISIEEAEKRLGVKIVLNPTPKAMPPYIENNDLPF